MVRVLEAMKYLITGAHGFVASHLMRELERHDRHATIVSVDRIGPGPNLDLLDLAAFVELVAREQPEYLIHLASLSSVGASWHDPVASFTNNTNIFLNV